MTILVLDIASFTHPARRVADQRTVHTALHTMVRQALAAAGIPPASCRIEDRGDGALVLVPATCPKLRLAGTWLTALAAAVRTHNAIHEYTSGMQIRVACHSGEVHVTEHGVVSPAVNLAFDLVEAQAAKQALAISDSPVALVTSDSFHEDVIAQLPGYVPANYDRISVTGKRLVTPAWLSLPLRDDRARVRPDDPGTVVPAG